ncbi:MULTISPECIES: PTS ascorbate transporter subunit IIC [Enterococcaceae]|uniref:PTS ascorbate transporter subunit IIC n=1 Tax=Enterococcaceae TaxID=81852 RepID=UPI00289002B5|nr:MULTISPECIES: PTS ascorbate transporter subunit IIC [Enterococcaceae]MDT2808765.1 PTS ascorbate transporter subunit IIC [Vagococcus lutrae]MDV7729944.1 PTS ascorbate transporter subunit IIC [Enterococcus faecium]
MQFFVDLLSQPSIIASLVVLVGLVALHKPITDIVGGTVRALLGFVVLLAGTNIIVESLNNFSKLFTKAFNMHGMIPSNEAAIGITVAKYGTIATFIFVIGLILNILLARFTKYKYIFLSSDHAFYMACCLTPVMILAGLNTLESIIFGSMILGVILCIFPAIAHPTMKIITGREDMSFAHFGTLEYWFSAKIGSLVNRDKKSKSIEDINFPKSLAFLQDSNVSVTLVMTILFFTVTAVAGPDYVSQLTDLSPYVWALLQAAQFAAGIIVLVQGVNMLLDEITPAFKGFSEKIVPNAVPGYPFAILFKGTSNALIAGFLVSLCGGLLSMVLQIIIGTTIVIPGIVMHFFCGGISAVFGNATGGRKGALIGPFIGGIILSFLPLLSTARFGHLGYSATYWSDSDFNVIGNILGFVADIGRLPIILVSIGIFIAPFIATIFSKKKNA